MMKGEYPIPVPSLVIPAFPRENRGASFWEIENTIKAYTAK